jgi:hypothetical protein
MPTFILAPRYRLDDETPWLEGIDPLRNYWLRVNGEISLTIPIGGAMVGTQAQWQQSIKQLRSLEEGQRMVIERPAGELVIQCVGINCYAIVTTINDAPVWHLFDQESIESLLMTSHPDWVCAPEHINLGRQLLAKSLGLVAA